MVIHSLNYKLTFRQSCTHNRLKHVSVALIFQHFYENALKIQENATHQIGEQFYDIFPPKILILTQLLACLL